MRKTILFILLLTLFIFALVGCGSNDTEKEEPAEQSTGEHIHSGGAATCAEEAVCAVCNQKYGEKTPHVFENATCTKPKTCKNCGATEGEALTHDFENATCTKPKACKNCGATEGEALTHDFENATCTTPKTCKNCGTTEGEALTHDFENATYTKPKTCKNCGATEGEAQHNYAVGYSHDEAYHWIECSVCHDKKDKTAHSGGEATYTERAMCELCGAAYGEVKKVQISWSTEAVTPSDNELVCLTNAVIMSWHERYDYKTTDTNSYMTGEDIFYPDPLTLKWTVGDKANYYKVYIADNADFTDSDCYLTTVCELVVEHLYTGREYYWFVDAVYSGYTVRSEVFTFMTQATPRTLNVDGVSNIRDIGGYITVDGMRIKQGMIYRSAKLDDITELGKYTLLNILGVKTDLDLRGARTSDGNGGYYSDLKNATRPVAELNHFVVACPWYATGENGIWNDSFNKTEFANAVKLFANPDNYPIVFHCSLGRDRTGTLAMVLGGLLGLDENTLMMEYELSAFSFWGAYNANYESLLSSIHGTYLYIAENYEGDTFSEKVSAFLIEIGVTADEIASIRSIMLEEVE